MTEVRFFKVQEILPYIPFVFIRKINLKGQCDVFQICNVLEDSVFPQAFIKKITDESMISSLFFYEIEKTSTDPKSEETSSLYLYCSSDASQRK